MSWRRQQSRAASATSTTSASGQWGKDTGHSRRNYSVVVREVGHLRETGRLPWEWIADGTRMVRQDTQYDSLDDAMQRNTETYGRNLWASQPRRVEVWCESGFLCPVTVVGACR